MRSHLICHTHPSKYQAHPSSHDEPSHLPFSSSHCVMEVIELKVHLHCKACEKALRKSLMKIKGITCVEIDVKLSKITVLGYIERKLVIKAIRKTGRRAEIWSQPLLSACRRGDSAAVAATYYNLHS